MYCKLVLMLWNIIQLTCSGSSPNSKTPIGAQLSRQWLNPTHQKQLSSDITQTAMGLSSPLCLRSSVFLFSALFAFTAVRCHSNILGVHPLDEKYYEGEVINCKDGSRSFTRDRLNDNFCDCSDGTDEPGTAACPEGKFYCRNAGSTPKFIFSSRVNDDICDCCDGSDEYEGKTRCQNTCIMGGNFQYKPDNYQTRTRDMFETHGSKSTTNNPDSMIQKLKGLKVVIILQVTLISCLLIVWVSRRRSRSKRRHVR